MTCIVYLLVPLGYLCGVQGMSLSLTAFLFGLCQVKVRRAVCGPRRWSPDHLVDPMYMIQSNRSTHLSCTLILIAILFISEAFTYSLNISRHAKVSNHCYLVYLRGIHLPTTPANTPRSACIVSLQPMAHTSYRVWLVSAYHIGSFLNHRYQQHGSQ